MSIKNFENIRWTNNNQSAVYRHSAAIEWVNEGSVIDLGCGDGLFLEMLEKKHIGGVGLDISDVAVARCRAKGLKVEKFDFSTGRLSIDSNTFDYVVLLDVLEHLHDPSILLSEAVRISKQYLIISVPNFNSLPARLQVLAGLVPENNKPNKGHVFWFSRNVFIDLLKGSDLEIIEEKVNVFWANKPIIGKFIILLSKMMPGLLGLSFLVKVKKYT